MRYAELTSLSDAELVHSEMSLEREMTAARFRLYTSQLEDSSRLGKLRKDIARVQTAIRARERAAGLGRNSLRDQHSTTFQAGGGSSDSAAQGAFLKGLIDKDKATE